MPTDVDAEKAAARREVIETDTFRIRQLDLGSLVVGKNAFGALVKNKTNAPLTLGLDLRTQPGLWFRNWQNQFVYQLAPEEETEIQANYQFLRMSPEASLRVFFGVPSIRDGGLIEIKHISFNRKYFVGKGNKAVDYDLSKFERRTTDHFEIFTIKGSLASRNSAEIIEQRESGYRMISNLLGVSFPAKIRLFFFPDAQSKTTETGHTGDGWAISNMIIEIYNEQTKLDPFHEVAHIIAGELGEPPAIFNEGFAVYSSERMGADALRYLGSPGKKVDETVQLEFGKGELIPLDSLFDYADIGPSGTRPGVSYPEAASFIKYLFEVYDRDRFRLAYQRLHKTDDPKILEKNRETFREIYGKSVLQMEGEWLKRFR